MQFLFPGFLWALLALAIPVVLHLFYFRRYKKVYFSNVKFLREVKEETSARNKLRNLLILLARCLALALIVFAFAQPFIPVDNEGEVGEKAVTVYVDNSFSMQSFGDDLPLLDKARQRAREIFLSYSETDRFRLLTNDLTLSQMRYMTREEALAQLEEIEIGPAAVPLSRINEQALRLANSEPEAISRTFYISDFQRSITDLPAADSSAGQTLVPVESVQEKNVAIDTVWFAEPVHLVQQTSMLIVKISNYSSDDIENVKLTSTIEGQEKPAGNLDIAAQSFVYDTIPVTVLNPGWHEVTLRITDFPVQFDDTWFTTFYVKEQVNILAIHAENPNRRLVAAFANNPLFALDTRNYGQLNYAEFRNYDLIVIDEIPTISTGMAEAMFNYVNSGGNVLLFPAVEGDLESYNGFLTRSNANTYGEYQEANRLIGSINTDSRIFRNVYIESSRNLRLPSTNGNYPVQVIQRRGGERLLSYRDGSHFLTQYPISKGNLIVSSAPLNEEVSQLAKNAEIFIPLVYNAAVISSSQQTPSLIIGENELVEVTMPEDNTERILRFSGAIEFIPRITPIGARYLVDPAGQISEAGFYQLYSADQLIGVYGFNYDRTESDLAHFSANELKETYGSQYTIMESASLTAFASALNQKEHGITLWRWCIIFALAFLGLETLLIRVWKT